MLQKEQVLQQIYAAPDATVSLFHGISLGDLDFRNHTFDIPVNFNGAVFSGKACFDGARFLHPAVFDSAVFHQPASFVGTRFERGAYFSVCSFKQTDFFQATFYGSALFWRAFFLEEANFSQAKVLKADWLPSDFDGQANFSWARFHQNAVFTYGEFEWPVYLHRTLFGGNASLDQCRFRNALLLNGKQNDVLFPRFGLIDPEAVRTLELKRLFRPDTERYRQHGNERVSEFVCFNNVLSQQDLAQKLEEIAEISGNDKRRVLAEWQAGAKKMFANGTLLTFRGAEFDDVESFVCKYVDLRGITVDRDIAGSPEQRKQFEKRLRSDACDLFVSHASEDKASVALPLTEKLSEMGHAVWLDQSQIEVGDRLLQSLDGGMERARFGLVILSQAYMSKKWTQYEVNQLLELSQKSGKKLFFIWHGVNEDQVREWSPALADRVAFSTQRLTVDELALEIAKAMR